MALALVRVHYPGVKLDELIRTNLEDREPMMFFDEVKEDAKYVHGACNLENVIEDGH